MSKAEEPRSAKRKPMLSFGLGMGQFSRKNAAGSGGNANNGEDGSDLDEVSSKYSSESFNASTHVNEYYRTHAPESAPEHISELEHLKEDLGKTLKGHVKDNYASYAQICKDTDGSDGQITQLSQMLNSLQWHLVGLQKSDVLADPKDVMENVDKLLETNSVAHQPVHVKTALLVKFMEGELVRQNGLYVVAALLCAKNLRLLPSSTFDCTLLKKTPPTNTTLVDLQKDKEEEYIKRILTTCIRVCNQSTNHQAQLKKKGDKPIDFLASSTLSRSVTSTLIHSDYADYTQTRGGVVDWRVFQKPIDSGSSEWRPRSAQRARAAPYALVQGDCYFGDTDYGVSAWIPHTTRTEAAPLRSILPKCLSVLRRTMRAMPQNSPEYCNTIWLQLYFGADDQAIRTHLHIINSTLHGTDASADPNAWLQVLISALGTRIEAAFAQDKSLLMLSPAIHAKVLAWTYTSVTEVVHSISIKLKSCQNPFSEAARAVKLLLLSVGEWQERGIGILAFCANACRSLLAGMVQERISTQKQVVMDKLQVETFDLQVSPVWPKTRVNFKNNLPPIHEAYVYHPMPPQVSASCRALIDGALEFQGLFTDLLEPQLRQECDLAAQISTGLSDLLEGYITELVKVGKRQKGCNSREQYQIYFACLANLYHTACGLIPTLLSQMSETLNGTVPASLWDLFRKALKLYALYWDVVSKSIALTWIRTPILEGSSSDNDAALAFLRNNIAEIRTRAVGILEWSDTVNLTGRYSGGTDLTVASFEQPEQQTLVSPRMLILCEAVSHIYSALLVSLSPIASVLLTCDLVLTCLKLLHEEAGWKRLFPSTRGSQTIVIDIFTLTYFTLYLTDCDTLAVVNTSSPTTNTEDVATLLPLQCKQIKEQMMQFAHSQTRRTGRIHAVSIEKSNEIPKKIIFDDEIYSNIAKKVLQYIRSQESK